MHPAPATASEPPADDQESVSPTLGNTSRRACRALVLGGGGARGALEVGALRALYEAGVQSDLWVGTSAGAINATYLALYGWTPAALDNLEGAWLDAARTNLLPMNYLRLSLSFLQGRASARTASRVHEFYVAHGLSPEMRFGALDGTRLILVATDLNTGNAHLFGLDPNDLLIDGLLASTALPPWIGPLDNQHGLLVDGGAVSNLPIEPALAQGATHILALDVSDRRVLAATAHDAKTFLLRLLLTVELRQIHVEKQLAATRGVPVHHVVLSADPPLESWDLARVEPLFAQGYAQMQRYLAQHPQALAAMGAPCR